jgi:hypothetical protein
MLVCPVSTLRGGVSCDTTKTDGYVDFLLDMQSRVPDLVRVLREAFRVLKPGASPGNLIRCVRLQQFCGYLLLVHNCFDLSC